MQSLSTFIRRKLRSVVMAHAPPLSLHTSLLPESPASEGNCFPDSFSFIIVAGVPSSSLFVVVMLEVLQKKTMTVMK